MPKPTWRGSGALVERVGINVSVGQIRRVPRPAHSYGSPAADLKKEQAEEEARLAAAALPVPGTSPK